MEEHLIWIGGGGGGYSCRVEDIVAVVVFFSSGNFSLSFVVMDVFLCFALINIHNNKRKLKIT